MLKKTFEYEDFDGQPQTEDFFFHLSKTEIAVLETSVPGGLVQQLRRLLAQQDVTEMMKVYKMLITSAVGVKSEDGKRFIKNQAIIDDFLASPAYDQLFMELSLAPGKATEFLRGLLPGDLTGKFDEEMKKEQMKERAIAASKAVSASEEPATE